MNVLKKQSVMSIVIASISLIILAKSAFSWSLNFTMVNKTDQPIVALWASPHSDDNWEAAASNVFVPDYGGSQALNFDHEATGDDCFYDIRFKFAKGTERQIPNIDLCTIRVLAISVSDDGDVAYSTDAGD